MRNNPHLEGLKIQPITLPHYHTIANNLQNLQKLTIICNRQAPVSATKFNILSRLNLTHLTFSNLSNDNFDDVLDIVAKFKMLRVFKLHVNMPAVYKDLVFDQLLITDLVQNLTHLEKLFLLEIPLIASTVVDIIRFGTNLENFHFHDCNIRVTESDVREIVIRRKLNQPNKMLTLFVDESVYWKTHLDKEGKRYLRFDFGCVHSRFI